MAIIGILTSIVALAQERPTVVNQPSPNASSLGVYGEMPVSYFTGIPNISVPLYQIKGKQIGLGLDLSYHAGGTRPEQHPGWTGLGWNLNAGGAITRTIKDLPDEMYQSAFPYSVGMTVNSSFVGASDWTSSSYLSAAYMLQNAPFNAISNDTEADVFSFSCQGISGIFFCNGSSCLVRSDRHLKVERLVPPPELANPNNTFFHTHASFIPHDHLSSTFYGFIITDEDGTKYQFGSLENDNAVEYSDDMYNSTPGERLFASSWMLTKITSADGTEAIDLSYDRGPFITSLYNSYSVSSVARPNSCGSATSCSSLSAGASRGGTIISPVYLKGIVSDKLNVSIEFSASESGELKYTYNQLLVNPDGSPGISLPNNFSSYLDITDDIPYLQTGAVPLGHTAAERYGRMIWLKLDEIRIKSLCDGYPVKRVFFSYSDDPGSRLFLNAVNIHGLHRLHAWQSPEPVYAALPVPRVIDDNAPEIQSYNFAYNATAIPDYLTSLTDHWGFSNGTSYLNTGYLSDRAPNALYAKAGVLEKIVYPTGGSTNFEYEANSYGTSLNAARTLNSHAGEAGGLRIKKISNRDNTGSVVTKEYLYVKDYQLNSDPASLGSSGVLDMEPRYEFNMVGGEMPMGCTINYSNTSSNAIIPLTTNSSGTHISYSEVAEKNPDGSFNRYFFTNQDNGYKDEGPSNTENATGIPYVPFNSREIERGKLYKQELFNNLGTLLKRTTTTYGKVESDAENRYVPNYSYSQKTICSNNVSDFFTTGVAYKIFYYAFLPVQVREEVFDNALTMENTTTMQYNGSYLKVVEKTATSSDGKTVRTTYKYPFDLPKTPVKTYMVNSNIVAKVLEEEQFLDNGSMAFKRNNYVQGSYYTVDLASVDMRKAGNPEETRLRMLGYDAEGNLLAVQKSDDIDYAYIWDYKKQHPVAEVANATTNDIAYTSFEFCDGGGGWLSFLGDQYYAYDAVKTMALNCPTGYHYANLVAYNKMGILMYPYAVKTDLNTARTYKVTYWAKNASIALYEAELDRDNLYYLPGAQLATPTLKYTNMYGWSLYECTFTGKDKVMIRGTGSIDELRLYPADAYMTTYTYYPLVGTTSVCDKNDRVIFYEYDGMGRMKLLKDDRGNILKTFEYKYQQPQ